MSASHSHPPRVSPDASAGPGRPTVDPRAAAREGRVLQGALPAAALGRLQESVADMARQSDQPVPAQVHEATWTARFELREHATDERRTRQDVWVHLEAQTRVPLVCQRCLAQYLEPLTVDRWFRFVKDEATADAEDDSAEEDLLVLDPRFDLAALVEDELLLALPLIPMHAQCPEPLLPGMAGTESDAAARGHAGDAGAHAPDRPNPFAVLQALQKKRD